MATVFSNDMVAHVWAQFTQSEGRSNNGNFYFTGRALYSYGAHYVAGYLTPDGGDYSRVGLALINDDSYSVSTGRHVGYASAAASHRVRVFVPNLTELARVFERAAVYDTARAKVSRELADRLKRHFSIPANVPESAGRSDVYAGRESVVAAVFAAAGCDNPERRARAAIAAADKREEKDKAKRDKAKNAALLRDAKRIAGINPDDMRAEVIWAARNAGPHDVERTRGAYEAQGREMNRAAKAAKAAGWTRVAADVRAVYRALRGALPEFEAAETRRNRLAVWGHKVRDLRNGLAVATAWRRGEPAPRVWRGTRTIEGNSFDINAAVDAARNLARYAETLPVDAERGGEHAGYGMAAPAARVAGIDGNRLARRLGQIADSLESVSDRMEHAERRAAEREKFALIVRGLRLPALTSDELAAMPADELSDRISTIRTAGSAVNDYGLRPYSWRTDPFRPMPGAWSVGGLTPARAAEWRDVLSDALTDAEGVAKARAAELKAARDAMAREAWRANGPAVRDDSGRIISVTTCPDGGAMVRAEHVTRDADGQIDGGTLRTSQGADVPLMHAIRAFRFLKACRDAGREWRANGRTLRVGHFAVDRVEPDGSFRAGCHAFKWPEIERLAASLGLSDIAPADTTETREHA